MKRVRLGGKSWIFLVDAVLLLVLCALVAARGGEIRRRIAYRQSGQVVVDGSIVALPPDDPFLEYLLGHGTRDTESTLAAMIGGALKPGDTFVDVGANIGWFTLLAAKAVGKTGRVIAFEPEPRNFALLKRNVALNGLTNVILEQKAVSDRAGRLRLNLSETNENHSVAVLGDQRGFIEVDSVRLDDYLAQLGGRVDCVKIDTEGAEGLILAGMPETLRRRDLKLFIEFDTYLLKAAGTDGAKLLDDLTASGFTIRRVDEASRRLVPIAERPAPSGNLFLRR